jgi:hypothetical protein
VFAGVVAVVFLLDVFLPPLVLSLARKPVDFFTFNPWLSKLPEFVTSPTVPLSRKLEFLPGLALFWFSADSLYGGAEWGFAVDVSDLARFVLMAGLVATYFVLWLYRRDQVARPGWGVRLGRHGGTAGVLVSVLGLSTGPCSVMGCGAPVIPVLGLAFVGLSSGTLSLLAGLSTWATTVVFVAMALGVIALAWLAGAARPAVPARPPRAAPLPTASRPSR